MSLLEEVDMQTRKHCAAAIARRRPMGRRACKLSTVRNNFGTHAGISLIHDFLGASTSSDSPAQAGHGRLRRRRLSARR